ncbi:MAG TPA: ABC transporter permease, partial [Actinotalea sp.]|nr:ABC transporter permease [Actinotalea sp.]
QPVTSTVDTVRGLLTEQPVGTDVWVALAWCVGILAIAYGLAVAAYRRKVS